MATVPLRRNRRGCALTAAATIVGITGWAGAPSLVDAQMTERLMSVEPFDGSSPRTIVGLLMLSCSVILSATVLFLLYTRRKMFPIAGRGAHLLLGLNGLLALLAATTSTTFFLFPDGLPCGVQFCLAWFFMPFVLLWLVRAWLLVYRLEICNYLSELAWRQNKLAQLQARQAESGDAPPAAVTSAPSAPLHSVRAVPVPVTPIDPLLALPSLDPATIEGSWFIRNRRFTERRWISLALCAVVPFNVLAFALPIVFDADIGFVDSWRESRGYPALEARSQFTHGAFLHSPRCFWYSIKVFIYFGITGCFLPYAFWAAWRVILSSKRMERRVQEQKEFAAAMLKASNGGAGHRSKPSHVVTSPVSAATASSDLDELASVKQEMLITIMLGGVIGMPLVFVETVFANAYVSLHFWLVSAVCLAVTGVEPVITSFRVAAKQREMFRKARSAGSTAVGGRSKFVAQIAHHRPLYRLRHLLHVDSFAYSLLLKFLQREYSSENALFCREARAFGQECKELEALLPGWRSTVDEDDDTSGGHLLSSITSAPGARKALQSTAVSLVAQPSVQVNNMMHAGPPSKRIVHRTGASVAPAPSPTMGSVAPSSADLTADGAHLATVTGSLQSSMILSHARQGSGMTATSHADARRLLRASYESAVTIPPASRSPQRSAKSRTSVQAAAAAASAVPPLRPAVAPAQTMSFRVMHQRVAKVRDWALKIYSDYLQPNAVYQINIDSDLSRLVASQIAHLRQWQPTPLDSDGQPDFDRAAMESAPPLPPPFPLSALYKQTALSVFNLMETDSFRRFLLTADFQLLLQRADDQELVRLQHATAAAADTAMMLARADAALAQSSAAGASSPVAAAIAAASPVNSPRLQIVSVPSGGHTANRRGTDGGVTSGSVLQHVRHLEQLQQPARPSISANHSTVANAAAIEPPSPLPAEPISPMPN